MCVSVCMCGESTWLISGINKDYFSAFLLRNNLTVEPRIHQLGLCIAKWLTAHLCFPSTGNTIYGHAFTWLLRMQTLFTNTNILTLRISRQFLRTFYIKDSRVH